ncbi:MAG: hypothetical protein QM750_03410 [Rubrivivax sp.]
MNTATLPQPKTFSPSAAPRLDLYAGIHKAWRRFLMDTLVRVGRLDVDDDAEREQVCAQVQSLMQAMRGHLQHENEFIHAAIEVRCPGGARTTAADHEQHVDAIADLDDEAQALRHARPAQRAALAQRLYRHLAAFVAHNLEHMAVEESANNALLWSLYGDDELAALHDRLLATIGFDEMALTLRWMAASLSPQELAGMFVDMRAKAPPAAFEALYDIALAHLDEPRRAKLARALGLPPVPGLLLHC